MDGHYIKRGRSIRFENGVIVRAAEAGEAREEGPLFTCAPIVAEPLPEFDGDAVEQTARRIQDAAGVMLERLVVTEGFAEHRFGGITWTEPHRRIHAALVRGSLRALVDILSFDDRHVATIARALGSAEAERDAPLRLRLAPHVAAALFPALIGVAPPNVTLVQKAGGRDGKGQLIEECRIGAPPWPNWYRPSYRVRPVRAPLNLSVRCEVTEIDEDLPRAMAILSPVEGLRMRVLIEERARFYPATVRVTRIDAVALETTFYPYGAGSFGAEMVL